MGGSTGAGVGAMVAAYVAAEKAGKYRHNPYERALLKSYQDAWDAAYRAGGTGSDVAHLAGLRAVRGAALSRPEAAG